MATSVGQLKLVADTKDFKRARKEMEQLKKSNKGMADQNKATGLSFKSMKVPIIAVGVAVLAAAAAFGVWATKQLDAADKLAKMSKELSISVETLSRFEFVASQSGISLDIMGKAIVKSQRVIVDAARGNKLYAETIQVLGLSTEELLKLNPEEQFEEIIEALGKVANKTERAAFTMEIFGKSGIKLAGIIEGGVEALREMGDISDKVGATITGALAKSAEETNDNLDKMGLAFKGISTTLFTLVAPAFETVTASVAEFVIGIADAFRRLVGIRNASPKKALKEIETDISESTDRIAELDKKRAPLIQRIIDGEGNRGGGRARRTFKQRLNSNTKILLEEMATLRELQKEKAKIEEKILTPAETPEATSTTANKVVSSIERQIKAQKEQVRVLLQQTDAFKQGADARKELLRDIQTEAELRRLGTEATFDQLKEMRRLIGLRNEFKDQIKAIQDSEKEAEEEKKAIAEAKKEREEAAAEAEEKRQEQINKLRADGRALTESLKTPQEEYEDRLRRINVLLTAQAINEDTAARATEKATEDKLRASKKWEDGITRAQRKIAEEAGDNAAKAEKLWTKGFDTISDAIAEWATGGEVDIKKLGVSFIKEIIRMEARAALSSIFGGSSGGGGGFGGVFSGIAGAIGSFFGGGGGDAAIFTAKGAIIQSPKTLARGGAIAGEQAAEGILPLTRTSSGDLGVKAVGMGGGGGIVIQNLIVQVIEREDSTAQEQADQNALAIEDKLNNLVISQIANQRRSGNMLNPVTAGGVF